MDAAFHIAAQQLARRPVRVLGLELRPFTLGHLFLLEELNCAFLPESADEPALSDLVTAVFVCSYFDARDAAKDLKRWWTPWFMRWWGRRCSKLSFLDEAFTFTTWLRDAYAMPECKSKGKPGEMGSVPLSWRILNMLIVECGMGYEEALDTPLSRANCLWVVEAWRRGDVHIPSTRQRWFKEWVAEQEAKRLSVASGQLSVESGGLDGSGGSETPGAETGPTEIGGA